MKGFKNIGFYAALILVLIILVMILYNNNTEPKVKYSEVIQHFKNMEVSSFEINDNILEYKLREIKDRPETTVEFTLFNVYWFMEQIQPYVDNATEMKALDNYDIIPPKPAPFWMAFIPYIFFGIIIVVFWFFMMNQMGGGSNSKAMSFGRAKLRTGNDMKKKITFADVAGADEEKEELTEVVEFLKNPKRFLELGARIPKGILLVGPPGTGKTYLAKAASGEAGVPFFSISGSDFVELYVGVGASRVRDTFDQAKKNAPCIVFIDEIDAVGRQRGAGLGGGHDEREQTLNQLLVEMDGFSENEGVIIMAATNRPDILDNALLRPGRFDRSIVINLPDVKAREAILQVHSKGKPLDETVNLETLSKTTSGFSPADLENILNEGALLAARRHKKAIDMHDMEDAMLKVVVGIEKKSKIVSPEAKKLTAYHEAGHACVIKFLKTQDPVHLISIIPRGLAGGFTFSLPSEDKAYLSKNQMFEEIVTLLGGRVAEALCLEDISTGASNDIARATAIARKMVTKYGMSELGTIAFGDNHEEVFIGRDFATQRNYSENVASQIDSEIKKIIEKAYENARNILQNCMDKLKIVADFLIEKETMSSEEFLNVFAE